MVKVVRLYSGVTIDLLQPITLSSTSAHYLKNVMRRKKGDTVIVFDGKSGEYEADIKYVSKGTVTLEPKKDILLKTTILDLKQQLGTGTL